MNDVEAQTTPPMGTLWSILNWLFCINYDVTDDTTNSNEVIDDDTYTEEYTNDGYKLSNAIMFHRIPLGNPLGIKPYGDAVPVPVQRYI